jgi:hypothetical protein
MFEQPAQRLLAANRRQRDCVGRLATTLGAHKQRFVVIEQFKYGRGGP